MNERERKRDCEEIGHEPEECSRTAGISRRTFIKASAAAIAVTAAGVPVSSGEDDLKAVEARYYKKLENEDIQCLLCPKECHVGDRERGYCGVRENREGSYYTLVYGQPCALHLDPIEKKPFFHVLPGTTSLSLSTVGCNMECKFCQNWQISQSRPEQVKTRYTPPGDIVKQAIALRSPSIAYTYGEPVVFIEYMQDIARLARQEDIKSVVVTGGYINKEPLRDLCRVVDAIKVDLKAFEESYYHDICSSELRPVLDTIEIIRAEGIWLEIVYLMVPTLNDDPAIIRRMARWLIANAGADVPIHFSRFFPHYRLRNIPPTPISSLEKAYDICREEGLQFVYVGNVPQHKTENTYCPSCSKKIISRRGYHILNLDIIKGQCRFCGEKIPGIWQEG
ncbi:MAG: AmmeMemoRadiSam system radical SAM enzyme [Candidatus Krumholzibacteria bacterium]|nr:AmmeMemoRadiSam system radical SAM enzyme [Candidatus Krumholzibacteria bacterium]